MDDRQRIDLLSYRLREIKRFCSMIKFKRTSIEIALQTSSRMWKTWKKRNFTEEEIYIFRCFIIVSCVY